MFAGIKTSTFFHFSLILLFCCSGQVLSNAQQERDSTNNRSFLSNIDSLRIATINFGKARFTPFIAPSYSPELDVLLSAGGLLTLSLQKDNPLLERSSIPFSIGYSSNKSLQINARFFIYGKDDNIRMVGEWWLKDMPDNYWGVGYEKGRNTVKSPETTGYQRAWWQFYQKIMIKLREDIYVGPILDFSRTKVSEMNPIMAEDPLVLRDGTNIRNTGIGLVMAYDSRDVAVNAYKGMLLDMSMTFYREFFGGEQIFSTFSLDYRQYKKLGEKRRVLSWNLKTKHSFGTVPWPELAQLGNPFDFRGYTWGRYRDRSYSLGVAEYRHMFHRKTKNKRGNYLSRSGFTAWVGIGAIGADIGEYKNWLPTYGIGYRFETETRMNVRIDYGRGTDSNSFYVTFNEAF